MDLDPLVYNASYYSFFRRLEEAGNESNYRRVCGLINSPNNSEEKLDLKSMDIDALVTDTCSSTRIVQKYQGPTTATNANQSIEAVFSLYLPPYAAINALEVEYDGKLLVANIKQKETAANEYNDALASGNSAFLAKKTDDGLFQVALGNIKLSSVLIVRLTIISDVGYHQNYLHYCLHRFWFPLGTYYVKVNIRLNLKNKLEKNNIQIKGYNFEKLDDGNIISIESKDGISKNIVLMVELPINDKPCVFIEGNPADPLSYAVGLSFRPGLDKVDSSELKQKAEYIFVLDCSGSMSGSRIQLSRRVLHFLMRSLSDSVKFNIIRFGTNFESIFGNKSMNYTDETLKLATKYIDDKVEADLGGTNLLSPLNHVLQLPYDHAYPRQIFVLTDGGIAKKESLITKIGKEQSTSRIFTVAIGNGADRDLCRRLAEAGGGDYRMVSEQSTEFEADVLDLLSLSMLPMVANLSMDWGQLALENQLVQAPPVIRPIYKNERMVLYALVKLSGEEKKEQEYTVQLSGVGPMGEELVYPLELKFLGADNHGTMLHTAGAAAHISSLEYIESKTSKSSNMYENAITEYALKYQLVSKYTSFVVTAENDTPTLDTPKLVDLNKQVSALQEDRLRPKSRRVVVLEPSQMAKSSGCCGGGEIVGSSGSSYNNNYGYYDDPINNTPEMIESQKKRESLLSIIKLQNANGSWTLSDNTKQYNTAECPFTEIENNYDLWLTILIIVNIEINFPTMKSIYINSINKSKKWIATQLPTTITCETLTNQAKSLLFPKMT